MKLVSRAIILSLLLLVTAVGTALRAETMDLETTNLVAEKLERLLETLDTDDSSKVAMSVRLADVYADRARLNEMAEKSKEASEDRLKAIKLFNSVFRELDKDQKSSVISQLAHLYHLTNQSTKAESLYKQILKNTKAYSNAAVAQAYVGMAEVEFAKRNYQKSEKNFNSAISLNDSRRNYITTRIAWCQYHLGKPVKASQTIYAPIASGAMDSDPVLKEDAVRDYATFLTSSHVGLKEIKTVAAIAPQAARKSILVNFATELDRLGKKKSALAVWAVIGEENKSNGDLEEHFRLVQIQYDLGNKESTVSALNQMMEVWKSKGCDSENDNCALLQARVKKLITDWGAAEERSPSRSLVQAYILYTNQFSDVNLSYWGAQAAHKQKMWKESIALYRKASELARDNSPKIFEGACLGEIEVAELSKDYDLRDQAYDYYLDVNPNGSKVLEVRYQKAHIQYDKKNFRDSANEFHHIATSNDPRQMQLREKAADISIEALIALRDEARLESWAKEYAGIFSHRQAEFQKIERDAVLNTQANIINDKDSSKGELRDSLEKLKSVNVSNAPVSEKVSHYKSRLVVAEKLENYSEVESAANGLLSVRPLSEKNRQLALSRKQWAAEMTGQHAAAFALAKQTNMSELSADERLIKLADLAEKAGQNPNGYYEKYLSITRNQAGAEGVIAKLVRQAGDPQATLKMYKRYQKRLHGNPELQANLALEVFAKTNDERFARNELQNIRIRRTQAGAVMGRFIFLSDFRYFVHKHRPTRLITKSPKLLKRSLNDRLYFINKTENEAKRAIRSGDWILQLVTLDAVKKHYDTLAYEISTLPVPRGLSKKQKAQYHVLLSQQAQPYTRKAAEVSDKIRDLANSSNTDTLVNDLRNTKDPLRKLVVRQAQILMPLLPDSSGLKIKRELAQSVARSSR